MSTTVALEPMLPSIQTAAPRVCRCGCRRSIENKRAGALYFSSNCRLRAHRDRQRCARVLMFRPPSCRCGAAAITELDPDGDLNCVRCGHQVAHVTAPISGFDTMAWLMISDGDGNRLRPLKRRGLRVVAVAA